MRWGWRSAAPARAGLAALLLAAAVAQAQGSDGPREEPPTLWNTLLFDSWLWSPTEGIAFGGVALWAILLAGAAAVRFAAPPRLLAAMAGAAFAFTFVWGLLPKPGELTEIGLPALAGLAVGWWAVRSTSHARDALQLGFLAAVLGAFAGVAVATATRTLWADVDALVFGGRRFVDVLFTLPGFAVTGVVLFKVVPDVVLAIEEANAEDGARTERGPGQGEAFTVTCLRCATEIKVDRSMKRFRVATDRFEFACPNCQYWMEWADPSQPGRAAG